MLRCWTLILALILQQLAGWQCVGCLPVSGADATWICESEFAPAGAEATSCCGSGEPDLAAQECCGEVGGEPDACCETTGIRLPVPIGLTGEGHRDGCGCDPTRCIITSGAPAAATMVSTTPLTGEIAKVKPLNLGGTFTAWRFGGEAAILCREQTRQQDASRGSRTASARALRTLICVWTI